MDDVEDNRSLYVEYFSYAGFRVDQAIDGEEAIAKATALLPDVIVMDLSMPGIDGWEATRRLRADPRTSKLSIVALTGHGEAPFRDRAQQAGIDAFLLKPCLPADLLAEVKTLLAKRAKSRS